MRQIPSLILCMRRRSGQMGGEAIKPVEFCKNRRVLRDRSTLVTTENSVVDVDCAAN